uniref:Uncharacterized protein n=1 Tax=Meloidogyne hapla TaxID=6305 RepID=A0A1I8C2I3_MELHA
MYFLTIICLLIQTYFLQCEPQFNEESRQNVAADLQQFSSIQNVEHSLEERHNDRDGDRTAFAAPINNNNNILRPQQQQKQPFNSVALNGENKQFFKIHYRDGIQKAIFDETQRRAPPDFEESNDLAGRKFDIYDDFNLVEPHKESSIFVPLIYRNETSSEEATSEKKKLFSTLKPQKAQTVRPLVAPELIGRQQISVRTTSPRPTPPIVRPPSQQTFAQLVPSQTVLPIQPTIRPLLIPSPQPRRPPPPPQPQFPQQGFQQQSRFISTSQQQSFQTTNNPIPNENIASIRTGERVVFLPNAQRLPPLAFANIPSPGFSGQQQQTFNLRRPQQQFPQFNQNNQNSDSIQRVANAVKTTNSNSFGTNPLIRPQITAMGRRTELRDGFNKINRLVKSVEEYFDLENDDNELIKNRNNSLNDGNVIQRPIIGQKNFKIKEVTSWREGHPQGDGFSPLKINPLRNWRRPVKNNFDDNTPLAPLQPIFHSTDSLLLKRVDGGITAADQFSLLRRRTRRGAKTD